MIVLLKLILQRYKNGKWFCGHSVIAAHGYDGPDRLIFIVKN